MCLSARQVGNSKPNGSRVFKLGTWNDLGISYKCYDFGVKRSRTYQAAGVSCTSIESSSAHHLVNNNTNNMLLGAKFLLLVKKILTTDCHSICNVTAYCTSVGCIWFKLFCNFLISVRLFFTLNPGLHSSYEISLRVDAHARLKTRDWKTRDHQKCRGGKRGTGKRGTVLKGVKNEGPKCRGGKRRTGKHGTIIPGVENATSSYGKPKLQVYLVFQSRVFQSRVFSVPKYTTLQQELLRITAKNRPTIHRNINLRYIK